MGTQQVDSSAGTVPSDTSGDLPVAGPHLADIVVGLDDTPSSRAALCWAAREARITGAGLRAVHVIDWPIGILAFGDHDVDHEGSVAEQEVRSSYRRGIRRLLDAVDPAEGWQLHYAEGHAG